MFLHMEILTHFYSKAILRSSRLDTETQRKPWDLPPVETLNQYGAFRPPPPVNHPVHQAAPDSLQDRNAENTGKCIIL